MATLCLSASNLKTIRAAMIAAASAPADSPSHREVRWIDAVRPLPVLRDWLAGGWGMIFSHPADFQEGGLEQDRWLVVISQEFRRAAVRPLACRLDASHADASWVGAIVQDHWFVQLEGTVADLAARQLRAQIAALEPRFVLVIDEQLRCRGLLRYRAANLRLSALDLLAPVAVMRQRSVERRAA
ncbi:MAG TPA: hypothetical protein VKT19_07300 [Steroidobacteraceae bacterium]|nr:hypothetical protein [Steroidobacteraceae bacterium]